ncbi:MAG: hypothetical protein IT204_19070 [Fimbriimonadaceae bacterium]|nr:hypothetical protein [Fimbriimonadaceae bacterium]
MAMPAEVQWEATEWSPEGLPVYRPGDRIRGRVALAPEHDAHTRGVQLWLGCAIHGSGSPEHYSLIEEHFIYEGDLTAGLPVNAEFSTVLSELAPLSYQGRRIKFDWQLILRVDIPIWPDQRLTYPFVVLPAERRD